MSAENQGLTDDELLNDVLSDEPAEIPAPEQVEQIEEPKEPEEPKGEVEAGAEDKPPIPPKPEWRKQEDAERARSAEAELANERAEKAALKQRLEALERPAPKAEQPKTSRPDPLLDPDGYAKAIRDELREEALNDRRNESLQEAHDANPKAFDEAYKAAQQAMAKGDVTLAARMQASRNPGKTLMGWHKEQKDRAEVGDDLGAYKQRLRDEALKDPEFRKAAIEAWRAEELAQQTNGRPRIDLAPSLNGASRANTSLKSNVEDVSDGELFQQVAG